MILELDLTYARDVWLPALVRRYLTTEDQSLIDVTVKIATSPATVVYSSGGDAVETREPQVALKFNRLGHQVDDSGGLPESSRWILEIRQRSGALESVVAASRRRNLAVAILLNTLMLAAGCLLVRYTRRSRQLAEAQMNFVANVSHELRTPLTVIRGAAHNLQRGVVRDSARIEQYAGLILQHTEQLSDMVAQVLEFAGAKQKRANAQHGPVVIAEVLSDSLAATAPDTQEAHCEVRLDIPPSLPCVSGDAAALRRVFQNLITNAAKHGGDGGWIGITATATNGGSPPMIEVQIADRGPGIPESELGDVFKPFFRGAAAQEQQTRGSGLGLSLVREIVEAHAGRISVRSESGRGTTFTVRLPTSNAGNPARANGDADKIVRDT
jgi:signal transduction histidine kinase